MLSTKPVCDISYSHMSNRRSIRTRKCHTLVQRKLFCDMYRITQSWIGISDCVDSRWFWEFFSNFGALRDTVCWRQFVISDNWDEESLNAPKSHFRLPQSKFCFSPTPSVPSLMALLFTNNIGLHEETECGSLTNWTELNGGTVRDILSNSELPPVIWCELC